MVIIWIYNGLGNQMFQYALGTYLEKEKGISGEEIFYDKNDLPSILNGRQIFSIEEIFEGPFYYTSQDMCARYLFISEWDDICKKFKLQLGRDSLFYKMYLRIKNLHNRNAICFFEKTSKLNIIDTKTKIKKEVFSEEKNYFFFGYWEEWFFLDSIRDELIAHKFKFKFNIEKFGETYYKIIKNNSVAVHIRRGDFIKESDSFWEGKSGFFWSLCDEEYYAKAMRLVEEKEKDILFVFFSDDFSYVERLYKNIQKKIIISGNKDYEDLQLMTLCKHNILANSTFSFWGAYLNVNDGLVVAPKIHYLYRKKNKISIRYFPRGKKWYCIDNGYIYSNMMRR